MKNFKLDMESFLQQVINGELRGRIRILNKKLEKDYISKVGVSGADCIDLTLCNVTDEGIEVEIAKGFDKNKNLFYEIALISYENITSISLKGDDYPLLTCDYMGNEHPYGKTIFCKNSRVKNIGENLDRCDKEIEDNLHFLSKKIIN
jgi:hypothetical protein